MTHNYKHTKVGDGITGAEVRGTGGGEEANGITDVYIAQRSPSIAVLMESLVDLHGAEKKIPWSVAGVGTASVVGAAPLLVLLTVIIPPLLLNSWKHLTRQGGTTTSSPSDKCWLKSVTSCTSAVRSASQSCNYRRKTNQNKPIQDRR